MQAEIKNGVALYIQQRLLSRLVINISMASPTNRFGEIRERMKEGKLTPEDVTNLDSLLKDVEDSLKKLREAVPAGRSSELYGW